MSLDWNYSQLCLINLKGYMLLSIILAVTFGEYLDRGGGGRLVDPPGRSSLWRLNDTLYPINTNDHRVNCGGFEVHWLKNKGECGICGDPIDETRDHENGGKYHVDFVSETFLQNEIINVTVETISDMFGYFEFRICPYNDDQSVTKECLNKNILEIGDTGYTRYKVWYQGYHVIPLQLPADLKCDKCLLQFQYHTGYLWGCDGDNCCYGCGPMQEEFYSCADIKILPDDTFKFNSLKRANFNKESSPYMEWWCIFQCVGEECMTPICSKQAHLRTKRQTRTCKAAGVWSGRTEMDNWCTTNCLSQRPYCPASHCKCESDSDSNVPTTTTQATTTPGKLQVTVSPSQFTSVIGDASVQIRCDITGSPPAITWYWIKIPFTSGYSTIIYQGTNNQNYRVEGSSTGPHLTIKDITVNDQADYMCVAVSVTGTTLSLKSRLYVEGDIPTVTVEPVTFTSNIGDSSFQILCSITGRPQATDWYWTITPVSGSSSTKIPKGTDDDKYSINNSATNPHLTIKNITSDDEADYVCWATNAVGTNSSPKSRLLVTGGNVPNIVRVMASAGCQYCNDKNNMTCSEWYCPEEYTVNIGLSGSLTSKVNQMADDFCTMCSHNDTACKELFCLPNRRMVSLAIQARCNLCSVSGMNCPDDPECVSSSDLQSGELSTTGCKAIGDWEGQAGMDMWCQNNCPNPGSCPSSHCLCSDFLNTGRLNSLTCTGAGAWVYSQAMAAWCNRNCPGNCPASHCSCVSPQTTPTTTMTTMTQRTTTRTIETTITIPLDTDLYSANAMNGIMCSICKKDGSYSGCSSKYCELYNPNLEEPNDSLNRVYTFSPAIFCQLAVKEGDTDLQKLFCGDIFAEVLPELQTVMCTACQDVGNGNGCEAYCG